MSYVFDNVSFNGDNGAILDSVSFRLPETGLCLIAGRSGSGKTSLLRLMNGLSSPSSGSIQFDGHDLHTCDLPRFRSNTVLITQEPAVVPGSVLDNIKLPLQFAVNRDRSIPDTEIRRLCARFGLEDSLLQQEASRMSGGEKQRIAIVRAILMKPRVLLADEPTSALDLRSESSVVDALIEMRHDRLLVIVSHSNAFLKSADMVLLMAVGRIVEQRESIDENTFRQFLDLTTERDKNG